MCVLVSSVSNLYPCHPVPICHLNASVQSLLVPAKAAMLRNKMQKNLSERKLFVLNIFQLLKAFGNLLAWVSVCLSHEIVIRRRRHTITGETIFISNTFEGAFGLMMKVPKKIPFTSLQKPFVFHKFFNKMEFCSQWEIPKIMQNSNQFTSSVFNPIRIKSWRRKQLVGESYFIVFKEKHITNHFRQNTVKIPIFYWF